MTSFTRAWSTAYEGQPAENEDVNLGATRIRNFKVDVRERMLVDHQWDDGATTGSNDGKHLHVTFMPQSMAPTLDTGDGAAYVQTVGGVAELVYKNSAGQIEQLTKSGGLAPNTVYGNFTVGGAFGVTGDSTFNGANITPVGIQGIGGQPFELFIDALNRPSLTFAVGTFIVWDATAGKLLFFVGGVQQMQLPP